MDQFPIYDHWVSKRMFDLDRVDQGQDPEAAPEIDQGAAADAAPAAEVVAVALVQKRSSHFSNLSALRSQALADSASQAPVDSEEKRRHGFQNYIDAQLEVLQWLLM